MQEKNQLYMLKDKILHFDDNVIPTIWGAGSGGGGWQNLPPCYKIFLKSGDAEADSALSNSKNKTLVKYLFEQKVTKHFSKRVTHHLIVI